VGARRVLITGVANFWGTRLAAELAGDPDVDQVVGVDDREPAGERPGRVTFVEGDLRSPDVVHVVRAAAPHVVVHNALVQFPGAGRSSRTVHDLNVVGTLQLLAACDSVPTVKALVVRASAAIYGGSPGDPAFFTEDMAATTAFRTRFQRDLAELEAYVASFARRNPAVTCTVLRFQPVVGPTLDTPITRLFRAPVFPAVLGFDPRVQLLHEDDSVTALAAAVRRPVKGAVNVAAPDAVSLSRLLWHLRRPALPIPHPVYLSVAGALGRTAGVRPSEDFAPFLRYGRGVDVRRLIDELGVHPRSTLEAVAP
jgi:UDP-glucose 4-epimerase